MSVIQGIICVLVLCELAVSRPVSIKSYAPSHADYKPTDYSFSYGVKDLHTRDIKQQWEKKNGDKVVGHYSLVEPDGSIRSVDYTADKHSGFKAVVKHSGHFQHPITHGKTHPTSHNEVQVIPANHKPAEDEGEPEPQYQIQYVYPNGEIAKDYHPPEEEDGQYQEEGKTAEHYEYSSSSEDDNKEQEQYAYAQHEEDAAESQRSAVHTTLQSLSPGQQSNKPKLTIKEEYEKVRIMPQLPVDLSLLKPNLEQVVDVSVIKPVEVNIHQDEFERAKQSFKEYKEQSRFSGQPSTIQPSQELSPEELKKFLSEYYGEVNKPIVEPHIESGFKPMRSKPQVPITKPNVPQTYRTNKKPTTTPGLGSYSSVNKTPAYTKYNAFPKYSYRGQIVPQTPNSDYGAINYNEKKKNDVGRLYRTVPSKGYVRYAKHVSYEQ